jgi:Fcf2 pre-rRNA processing
MPATELTDERRRDLELLQMRDILDPKTHYRRPDRKEGVLPKYFQVTLVYATVSYQSLIRWAHLGGKDCGHKCGFLLVPDDSP